MFAFGTTERGSGHCVLAAATTTWVHQRATNVEVSQSAKEMRVPGDRGAMSNDESAGTRVMSSAK